MTERMRDFLEAAQIDTFSLQQLKTGASGASVWRCTRSGERCVAKYTEKAAVSWEIWCGSVREYEFLTAGKELDFLPEVLFARREEDALLIVEREYTPIAAGEWTDALLNDAMALCARMHAAEMPEADVSAAQEETPGDDWKAENSLGLWLRLARRFPDRIDSGLLERICADFAEIPARIEKLCLPKGLCHGDCHPENFLLDGEKLRLVDWQGMQAGIGVGDIAFFFSRGEDMGVKMDENALTEAYLKALAKEGVGLSREAFDIYCAASTLTVSFRFWAMFLQESPGERVQEIYRPMAEAYRLLFE